MKFEIEVRRTRMSATQGEAKVYINGHYVMSFGDKIELLKEGEPYFGEKIGGWASMESDTSFVRGMLCHKYEEIYRFHEKMGAVLDSIEAEERGDDMLSRLRKKATEYVLTQGGYGNIREADETYNDINREQLAALVKLHGKIYLGKRNIWDRTERQEIMNGTRSVYTEYTGGLIRNFACDFAVPVKDELLEEMIREWNSDETLPKKWSDASKATDRVEEIGGINFVWF